MTDKDYVCEDYGDQKDWVQVRVSAPLTQLEVLSSVMSMINENLMIEDYSDIDLKTCYGDLIDESILNADKTVAAVSVFLPADVGISDALAFLRERMEADGIDGKVTLQGVNEEDWANNWKQYYKPMEIGERLLVIPEWEQENVKGQAKYAGKVPLILEPGLTFGTGSHATTRLCLTALEEAVHGGETVLDLGCGSGILSIAALRLGAVSAKAVDIDDKCLTVAYENAALNDIGKDRYTVLVGDVLSNGALRETLGGGYDVVVANIVADVIIGLAPMVRQFLKPGGLFLCSGIIDTRAGEVADALRQNGWEIETTRSGEGWYSYACR